MEKNHGVYYVCNQNILCLRCYNITYMFYKKERLLLFCTQLLPKRIGQLKTTSKKTKSAPCFTTSYPAGVLQFCKSSSGPRYSHWFQETEFLYSGGLLAFHIHPHDFSLRIVPQKIPQIPLLRQFFTQGMAKLHPTGQGAPRVRVKCLTLLLLKDLKQCEGHMIPLAFKRNHVTPKRMIPLTLRLLFSSPNTTSWDRSSVPTNRYTLSVWSSSSFETIALYSSSATYKKGVFIQYS